jgi:hypothetical protein
MSTMAAKGWRFYVGLGLFGYGLAALGVAALAPALFAPALAATVATGVLVSGEVGFWVGAALLGKPLVEALKAKVKGFFVRPSAQPPAHDPSAGAATPPA